MSDESGKALTTAGLVGGVVGGLEFLTSHGRLRGGPSTRPALGARRYLGLDPDQSTGPQEHP